MIKIDVIIPCTKKDQSNLNRCVKSIRKYVRGVNNIYIITKDKIKSKEKIIPETEFPFSFQEIKNTGKFDSNLRVGWYLQQLLKFYSPFVIPNVTENILIVDSDIVFLNKIDLFHQNIPKYAYEKKPIVNSYYKHLKKLLPQIETYENRTAICQHMIFNKEVLKKLFKEVKNTHKEEFWKAFIHSIEPQYKYLSGASEFEIYYNFLNYKKIPHISRIVKYKRTTFNNPINRFYYRTTNHIFITNDSYMRVGHKFLKSLEKGVTHLSKFKTIKKILQSKFFLKITEILPQKEKIRHKIKNL